MASFTRGYPPLGHVSGATLSRIEAALKTALEPA